MYEKTSCSRFPAHANDQVEQYRQDVAAVRRVSQMGDPIFKCRRVDCWLFCLMHFVILLFYSVYPDWHRVIGNIRESWLYSPQNMKFFYVPNRPDRLGPMSTGSFVLGGVKLS